MNKKKNKKVKINIKSFIVIISTVFSCILCILFIINIKNKIEFDKKKQEIIENPMKVYENGMQAEFDDFLEHCEWDREDIDIAVFGVEQGNDEMDRYYVDDKVVMGELIDMLDDIDYIGATYLAEDKRKDWLWRIQLINKEFEYSIVFDAYSTEDKNVNIINIKSRYSHYDSSGKRTFPGFSSFVGDCCIDYDAKSFEEITRISDEYVKEITYEEIKEIKAKNSKEFDDYFKKMHSYSRTSNIYDEEEKMGILTIVHKFPIMDSDCCMEVERYNENGGEYENKYTRVNIERVHIVNEKGERIELFECTDEELDAFVK